MAVQSLFSVWFIKGSVLAGLYNSGMRLIAHILLSGIVKANEQILESLIPTTAIYFCLVQDIWKLLTHPSPNESTISINSFCYKYFDNIYLLELLLSNF